MGRRRGGRGGKANEDEPRPDPADVYALGGDAIVAVDFTERGFPIGATVREFRESPAHLDRRAGWARAKRAIARAVERAAGGAHVDVDWVSKLGEGLLRGAWGAAVTVEPDPAGLSGDWLALVPGRDADGDVEARVEREIRLLGWLAERDLPFRTPRALPYAGEGILVRQWLAGAPVDPRAGRQDFVRPWEVTGEVAAAVHRIEPPDFVPGRATRRDHALARLEVLSQLDDPLATEARLWALERLPPADASVLLHGDLLGQNVLFHFDLPVGVIDWEYAGRGDPAYDLAIVTRGVRRPFGLDSGLEKLLDAYARHGGQSVNADHVRIHELSLVAGWLVAERDAGCAHHEADLFRSLARRTMG